MSETLNLIGRYGNITQEKISGATYTPKQLSDFVAEQIIQTVNLLSFPTTIRVLDPAVGDGELLVSLLEKLREISRVVIEIHGFDTCQDALNLATMRLKKFPNVSVHFELGNFLDFVLENFGDSNNGDLFQSKVPDTYDLIIANPPYVRTQILGTNQAKHLAKRFGLSGRVDLYYAFILAIARVLKPQGVAGIIASNRFMTTKSGARVRQAIRNKFSIRHIWDLGDTKLFDAAVLPAILLVEGRSKYRAASSAFTSIYETTKPSQELAPSPIDALYKQGVVQTNDGRRFLVRHGKLDTRGPSGDIWRISTKSTDSWLGIVEKYTWGNFRSIGKVRVGVKTCADKVFIRSDWQHLPDGCPELLRPLTTHHIASRFKAIPLSKSRAILYPHEVVDGKCRAVDLSRYPRSEAYLEKHRHILEARKYLLETKREWYEIWVQQDPSAWGYPKLVFRDISNKPMFWIDQTGSIVNGDCYWLICPERPDLLWLALAIGNSTFIEEFYDHRFHNKLYAGRRRFITQYVEQFPLPDPASQLSKSIIKKAKEIYASAPFEGSGPLESELNLLVWEAFGLPIKEIRR
ncbi:MAG TPA: N-6 DNA methylase [Pyrinomonadaceae bacterium]|jgi:methylase of polypeptide subunit release factors